MFIKQNLNIKYKNTLKKFEPKQPLGPSEKVKQLQNIVYEYVYVYNQ